jgi:hypothetical protein
VDGKLEDKEIMHEREQRLWNTVAEIMEKGSSALHQDMNLS